MPFSESLRMVLDTEWFLTEIIQRLQFALIRVHIGWNDFLRDVTTNTYTFPKKINSCFVLTVPQSSAHLENTKIKTLAPVPLLLPFNRDFFHRQLNNLNKVFPKIKEIICHNQLKQKHDYISCFKVKVLRNEKRTIYVCGSTITYSHDIIQYPHIPPAPRKAGPRHNIGGSQLPGRRFGHPNS